MPAVKNNPATAMDFNDELMPLSGVEFELMSFQSPTNVKAHPIQVERVESTNNNSKFKRPPHSARDVLRSKIELW